MTQKSQNKTSANTASSRYATTIEDAYESTGSDHEREEEIHRYDEVDEQRRQVPMDDYEMTESDIEREAAINMTDKNTAARNLSESVPKGKK